MEEIITCNDVYRLVRVVGRGGMGTVYEALLEGAEGFQKRVAIKTILTELCDDDEFIDMFIGEAKLVADLVHENIVQIYQLGRTEGGYFIAMEYINGVDLEQFANRHVEYGMKLPAEWAVFIASRVCRALEYAHTKCGRDGRPLNVVHRDVSPRNIMIRIDGVVKLGDFGVAKAAHFMADKEGEVLVGKWRYMSPEQAAYEPTDARSDLFSLGLILYEMLAGKSLFEGDTPEEIQRSMEDYEDRLASLPEENPEVSMALAGILQRMLQRCPEERYPDAATLGYELEYLMYHKGYGPTNQKLGEYMRKMFPEIGTEHLLAE